MQTKSFYHFLQTVNDPYKTDRFTQFANVATQDVAFPKQAYHYDVIANYVELTDSYNTLIDVFDALWEQYDQ